MVTNNTGAVLYSVGEKVLAPETPDTFHKVLVVCRRRHDVGEILFFGPTEEFELAAETAAELMDALFMGTPHVNGGRPIINHPRLRYVVSADDIVIHAGPDAFGLKHGDRYPYGRQHITVYGAGPRTYAEARVACAALLGGGADTPYREVRAGDMLLRATYRDGWQAGACLYVVTHTPEHPDEWIRAQMLLRVEAREDGHTFLINSGGWSLGPDTTEPGAALIVVTRLVTAEDLRFLHKHADDFDNIAGHSGRACWASWLKSCLYSTRLDNTVRSGIHALLAEAGLCPAVLPEIHSAEWRLHAKYDLWVAEDGRAVITYANNKPDAQHAGLSLLEAGIGHYEATDGAHSHVLRSVGAMP